MVAIRQEISLSNTLDTFYSGSNIWIGAAGGYDQRDTVFAKARCDADDYNGETAYLEIVAKNGSPSTTDDLIFARASSENGTYSSFTNSTITVPVNTSSFTIFRSSAITLSSSDIYYAAYCNISISSVEVASAKIIILQSATDITATQTQIEIGLYATAIPAVANTWYLSPSPKYWKYEASKWDGTKTVKLGITVGCEDDMETYNFGLYDVTDADYGAGDALKNLVASVTTESPTYYESSDFLSALEDGHVYCLAYVGDDNRDDIYFFNAKIIVTQTDATAITKLQPEYLLINQEQTTDAGDLVEFSTDFDANEWSGVTNTYYHEHSADDATSNTKLKDSSGDITSSSITGTGLQRSSGLTLTDDEEIYPNVVESGD